MCRNGGGKKGREGKCIGKVRRRLGIHRNGKETKRPKGSMWERLEDKGTERVMHRSGRK